LEPHSPDGLFVSKEARQYICDCLQWTNCDVHNFSPSYLQISGVINSFYEILEPSSAALVFLGLGAAGVARRVRRED
jgi:hypothetical protein